MVRVPVVGSTARALVGATHPGPAGAVTVVPGGEWTSADLGWGAWSVEAGWGPAWTAATLALRERKTTMWEMTATSRIRAQLPRVRAEMSKNDGVPLNFPP